ncbi:nitroreductase [Rhodoplanes sp. TEM]|uniref:Nitroreductase n=1 Tax=Rhodoplanes tepidamans TaxID=200616 RepID=A0ABT5JEN2_RHOTP|nr:MULTISPECIES: nitroreductase [Rhodoplanes]MDC7788146.1 nitroreductase [Rhodoplanes tepidamans]MDC7987262.1 nitroreductase [Rhodoplanes sp. TEM]MDQ0355164.1 nitroreductase [Rhodoplanes tepidamans]
MHVFEAVDSRKSCRAFLPTPVDGAVVRELITRATRAASGGNLQPWSVTALTGAPLADLVAKVRAALETVDPRGLNDEFPVYPEPLFEPFRSRRFENGVALYRALGVARDDDAGRLAHYKDNYAFFGAPVGLFLSLDRRCGPGQWTDVGGFLATLMLLARGWGLSTCAQESWSRVAGLVRPLIGLPDTEMLFCGVAVGFADESAPVNRFRTARAGVDEVCRFVGFDPA